MLLDRKAVTTLHGVLNFNPSIWVPCAGVLVCPFLEDSAASVFNGQSTNNDTNDASSALPLVIHSSSRLTKLKGVERECAKRRTCHTTEVISRRGSSALYSQCELGKRIFRPSHQKFTYNSIACPWQQIALIQFFNQPFLHSSKLSIHRFNRVP